GKVGVTHEPPELCLIEKRGRLGGVILTEATDDFIIEGGPDSFLSQKPWALELCQKLGLEDRLVGTREDQRKTYVFSRGKLEELPEGLTLMVPTQIKPFLRSGLISLPGKIRMALDLLLPRKVIEEDEDEPMGAFVRRRLGREALERIAEPLMAGIYAGSADQISLKATFPNFLALEQEYGSLIRGMWHKRQEALKHQQVPAPKDSSLITHHSSLITHHSSLSSKWALFMTLWGGLTELVQALAAKLDRVSFITGHQVTRIDPHFDEAPQRPIYDLYLANGDLLQADVVVLATPAYVAADLVEEFSTFLANILRNIPYVSTATVSLGYKKSDFPRLPHGFGFVVPRIENHKIIASTWTSNKYPHRAPDEDILLRCYLGGSGREDLVALDDSALIQIVREDLKAIMGIGQEPILSRVYRWEKAMPQYLVGHLDQVDTLDEYLSYYPGLFLTGNAYRGVGIPDCIHNGILTAEKVFQYLLTLKLS
ncbi:MAG: protoporphyrinogen oxidase, partial [Nitrospira sp.]|nr:protoporphyrinogen oxidase [Nitrospira sp.]